MGQCQCVNRGSQGSNWAEPLCVNDCSFGYWGFSCSFACSCNHHGSCDKASATSCTCLSDDVLGHWDGSACDVCAERYINEQSGCITYDQSVTLGGWRLHLKKGVKGWKAQRKRPRTGFRTHGHTRSGWVGGGRRRHQFHTVPPCWNGENSSISISGLSLRTHG